MEDRSICNHGYMHGVNCPECDTCTDCEHDVSCGENSELNDLLCGRNDFDEEKYYQDLWDCYLKGICSGLPDKDLFIALVRDLVKQVKQQAT